MFLLRVRYIVVLSLVYLLFVLMLYNYLWKTYSFRRNLSFLDFSYQYNEQDAYDFLEDKVQFNFKRRNGFFEDSNGTNSSGTELVLTPPADFENESIVNTLNHRVIKKAMFDLSSLAPPSNCMHAFYYMWYGSKDFDGRYYHWNHPYLPHWQESVAKRFPKGSHEPPDDIGASFYPKLGCYSSKDPAVMESHMHQLRQAGIGVIAVSWYPEGMADDQGFPPNPLIPALLEIAWMYSIQVTIHIEPYRGRTPLTVRGDLKYIIDNYSNHPAFYKHPKTDPLTGITNQLPLIYVYDSYLNSAMEWARVLKTGMPNSIRGTDLDSVVIGLVVGREHQQAIISGGFDGFYTYFASNGFCYGSTTTNWRALSNFASKNGLIFIPSFGPGYDDVRVRPWNSMNTKPRRNGEYFKEMAREAVRSRVSWRGRKTGEGLVSLTSFNEWHEGTQIESAIPKMADEYKYDDYTPNLPEFYLQLTRDITGNMRCTL